MILTFIVKTMEGELRAIIWFFLDTIWFGKKFILVVAEIGAPGIQPFQKAATQQCLG